MTKLSSSPSAPHHSLPSCLMALSASLMLVLLLVVPSRAFEFDIPSDAARQFGPSAQGVGQRGALLFADPETNLEDNAGFVGGMPVSARRRLIQPPPLKRSAGTLRAERMDWLLAGLRPRGD